MDSASPTPPRIAPVAARRPTAAALPMFLHSSRGFPTPSSWSSDGRLHRARRPDADDGWTTSGFRISPKAEAGRGRPFVQRPPRVTSRSFLPTASGWRTSSNESGRTRSTCSRIPVRAREIQVSTQGGDAPAWTSNGAEIVYVAARRSDRPHDDGRRCARRRAGGLISVDTPRKLFEGRFTFTGPVRGYDVTPDGRRFLMVQPRDAPPQPPVELVLVGELVQDS